MKSDFNSNNQRSLLGGLLYLGQDCSMDVIIKKYILIYSHHDVEIAESALIEWEQLGVLKILCDFKTATLETSVVKIDLEKLKKLDAEDAAKFRVEMYRQMNSEERAELLRRLDGPKLRIETLNYLDPEERAEALKHLDPALLVVTEQGTRNKEQTDYYEARDRILRNKGGVKVFL